jgi:hypothetical protein
VLITLHDDTHAVERSWPKLHLLEVVEFRLDVGMQEKVQKEELHSCRAGRRAESGGTAERRVRPMWPLGICRSTQVQPRDNLVNEREIAESLIVEARGNDRA